MLYDFSTGIVSVVMTERHLPLFCLVAVLCSQPISFDMGKSTCKGHGGVTGYLLFTENILSV